MNHQINLIFIHNLKEIIIFYDFILDFTIKMAYYRETEWRIGMIWGIIWESVLDHHISTDQIPDR